MKATATFVPTKWDEKTYDELRSNMKMTKASVEYAYKGQIEGTGTVEYVMFYSSYDSSDPHKSTAVYVGLIRFQGKVQGKSGGFVFEDRGMFQNGVASSTIKIIPGSGTDELRGITGTGSSAATPKSSQFELDFELM